MITRGKAAIAACLCAALLGISSAAAWWQSIQQISISAAAAYAGPGDITSFTTWAGLRAYSAAYATSLGRIANVCIPADATCADLSSDVNGNLVITTIGGSSCSVVTCTVKTLYDQSGTSNDFTNATIANRPVLTVNCIGSLPCMTFSGTQALSNSSIGAVSQIYSMSLVAKRTTINTAADCILCTNSANNDIVFHGSGFVAAIWNSAFIDAAATENTWHALQGVANGSSSSLTVDGSTATVSPGTAATTNPYVIGAGQVGASTSQLKGTVGEVGFKNGNLTASIASINSNQRAYWGF